MYDTNELDLQNSLAVGDRVTAGPTWQWECQNLHADTDEPMVGVVVERDKDNWVVVEWEDGTRNCYRDGIDLLLYTYEPDDTVWRDLTKVT